MRNHENLQSVVAAIIINAKSLYANIFGEKKQNKKKSKTEKTITKFQDFLRGVTALNYKCYRSHQIYKYSKV